MVVMVDGTTELCSYFKFCAGAKVKRHSISVQINSKWFYINYNVRIRHILIYIKEPSKANK